MPRNRTSCSHSFSHGPLIPSPYPSLLLLSPPPPPHYISQNVKFFSVPPHTPVILAESADCGTTLMRFLCGDASGSHESRQLTTYCPNWVKDITCQVGGAKVMGITCQACV